MSPEELAARRSQAIEALQAQMSGHVDAAQHELLSGLLSRLQHIQADPAALLPLLAEYQAAIAGPLATFYAQALLTLPGHTVAYFADLGVAGYNKLRAPLTDFLTARLGITAEGLPVPGGYLSTLAGDTSVQRGVLNYAYSAQAAGVGLDAYRAGLMELLSGPAESTAKGLVQELYAASYDSFNQNDRQLQALSAQRLGLKAYLYQGGLIASSRPFCQVRNGKVFLDWEIERFGTKEDEFGGYIDKQAGEFSGKSVPYEPYTDCGGWNCRHGLHALPSSVALRLRPELAEDKDGKLCIKAL